MRCSHGSEMVQCWSKLFLCGNEESGARLSAAPAVESGWSSVVSRCSPVVVAGVGVAAAEVGCAAGSAELAVVVSAELPSGSSWKVVFPVHL